MLIADPIFEEPCDFCPIVKSVSAVTSHAGFSILTDVLVSKLEVGDDPAIKISSLELPLEDSVHVLQVASTVQLSVLEFAFVVETGLGLPLVEAFAVELAIFELPFVGISIVEAQASFAVEDVGEELPFVNNLLA